MRDKIYTFFTNRFVIILTILISSVPGGPGYFFGLTIAFLVLWGSKFNWLTFGIGKIDWIKTILKAILIAISIFVLVDVFIQPFIEIYLGAIDLSSFDGIRGNVANYLIFVIFMWIVAGFGEEFLYRGFFMKQLAKVLGNTNKAWLISAIIISILFGLAHLYQGLSGVITTGLIGFLMSLVFYNNRKNLILAMLVHGFYDMIGITLIFLNKERTIVDWIQINFL